MIWAKASLLHRQVPAISKDTGHMDKQRELAGHDRGKEEFNLDQRRAFEGDSDSAESERQGVHHPLLLLAPRDIKSHHWLPYLGTISEHRVRPARNN